MDEYQLKRMELLENRLHDHIEHYASNNKTLALLSQRMDYFIQKFEEHDRKEIEYNKAVDGYFKKLQTFDLDRAAELVDGYKGVMTLRNILLGLAAIAIATGTIGAAIIGIIHVIRG